MTPTEPVESGEPCSYCGATNHAAQRGNLCPDFVADQRAQLGEPSDLAAAEAKARDVLPSFEEWIALYRAERLSS